MNKTSSGAKRAEISFISCQDSWGSSRMNTIKPQTLDIQFHYKSKSVNFSWLSLKSAIKQVP